METHTFQVGDRVLLKNERVKGYITYLEDPEGEGDLKHTHVVRDDGKHPRPEGYWTTSLEYIEHDMDIRPGDWVRHESLDGVDQELCGKIFQRKIPDNNVCNVMITTTDEYLFIGNCVKIQPPAEENNMNKTTPTPEEQWKATYYPVPASEMKDKSDLECLDHAIKKYRGYRSEVLEELGLDVAPIDSGSAECALCVNHLDRNHKITVDGCETCPLVVYGQGSCLGKGSVWKKSFDIDNPQLMIDELIQVKKKVIAEKTKKKVEPQFYVNGHGPYSELMISERQPGEMSWHIANINKEGIRIIGAISLDTTFKTEDDHIKVTHE